MNKTRCKTVMKFVDYETFHSLYQNFAGLKWILSKNSLVLAKRILFFFPQHPTKMLLSQFLCMSWRKAENLRQLLNHVICLLKAHFASLCVTCMNFGVYEMKTKWGGDEKKTADSKNAGKLPMWLREVKACRKSRIPSPSAHTSVW